ncbi:MAG: hypothetical protein ACPGPS_04005 [Rubripirellula sp.]
MAQLSLFDEVPQEPQPGDAVEAVRGHFNGDVDGWIRAHGARGIIDPSEVPDLTQASGRVLALLNDGEWRTADAIRGAAGRFGAPASEGLRRMRDLRPLLEKVGLEIVKRRCGDSRLFEYRIQRVKGDD